MTAHLTPPDAIVTGYDASPTADLALDWASAVARQTGRELHILGARESVSAPDLTAQATERVAERHPELSVSASAPVGNARYLLVDAAQTASTIVLGNRGRSRWRAALLGTVSLSTAMHATCPVVIVRSTSPATAPPRRIVVGVDGSATSVSAARYAAALAPEGSSIRLVMAWPTAAHPEQIPCAATEILDQLQIDTAANVEVTRQALPGHPVDVLTSLAREADLLVMGRRGNEGFTGLHMGSTAQHVLYETSCPVAILPQQD